jgi:hypothetical protein
MLHLILVKTTWFESFFNQILIITIEKYANGHQSQLLWLTNIMIGLGLGKGT